jgi:HSP20 family protein
MQVYPWYPTAAYRPRNRRSQALAPNAGEPQIDWYPAIEWRETEDTFIIKAELPGVEANHLDVRVSRDRLTIAGNYPQPEANDGRYRSEFRYGRFARQIPLSVPIDSEGAIAKLDNGILTLTLPKYSAVRPEVVKVSLTPDVGETPEPEVRSETEEVEPNSPEPEANVSPRDRELTEDLWGATV